jgi:hypothetical protein
MLRYVSGKEVSGKDKNKSKGGVAAFRALVCGEPIDEKREPH